MNKKDFYSLYQNFLYFISFRILEKLTIRNYISIVRGREKEGGDKERRTRSWRDKRYTRQKIPRQPGNKRQLVDFVADFFS